MKFASCLLCAQSVFVQSMGRRGLRMSRDAKVYKPQLLLVAVASRSCGPTPLLAPATVVQQVLTVLFTAACYTTALLARSSTVRRYGFYEGSPCRMGVILPSCCEVNGFVTASLAGWNDVVSTAGAAKQYGCSSDEQPGSATRP